MQLSVPRLALNLGSSYAHILLMAAVTLCAVPVYATRLGPQEWGIVALCLTLQGALHALDIMLAPLMLRDVARAAALGQAAHGYQRYRRLYGGLGLALGFAGGLLLLLLPPGALTLPLALALLQFVLQFANHAAMGYWHGLQQQAQANLRLALFQALKHASALVIVCWVDPSAWAFLCPFVLIGALEWALNQRRVLAALPRTPAALATRTDWGDLRRYALAAGLGLLCTQIDRIVLSLALPLSAYGQYYLLCSLLLSALSLQVPVQRAFLPQIATASASRAPARAMLRTSLLLLVLPCLIAAAGAESLLRIWLGPTSLAPESTTTLQIMLVAAALIALYGPTGAEWLSQHQYRRLALLHGITLLLQLAILLGLGSTHGMLAGALAWLSLGLLQALAALWARRAAARPAPGRLP